MPRLRASRRGVESSGAPGLLLANDVVAVVKDEAAVTNDMHDDTVTGDKGPFLGGLSPEARLAGSEWVPKSLLSRTVTRAAKSPSCEEALE